MNNKLTKLSFALALLPLGVQAGGHYICYQEFNNTNPMVGVYACRAEPGGRCDVIRPTNSYYLNPPMTTPISDWEARLGLYSSSGTIVGTIRFWKPGNTSSLPDEQHSCSIEFQFQQASYATPGAVLEGYTTDASGKISTGVWRKNSGYAAGLEPRRNSQTIRTPWDFVAVGGGAEGVEFSSGALIYKSEWGNDSYKREWSVGTQDDDIDIQPHNNNAYVIGMKIEGLKVLELRTLIDRFSSSSEPAAHPVASISLPWGYEMLGGGISTWTPYAPGSVSYGQFATSTAFGRCSIYPCVYDPALMRIWRVGSKDHRISRPGTVTASVGGISSNIIINGVGYAVESKVFAASSAVDQHPSVVVNGQLGQYALTGVGASVNWSKYGDWGNLLWKLKPRADIAGVEVASKDQGLYSPARITGYAIGIKLVQLPKFETLY